MTANDLRRSQSVKVLGRWRKIASVWLQSDIVVVSFANGDSIRWPKGFTVEVK